NDQLVNKIILQKEDEKIQEYNKKTAERKMAMIQLENNLREKVVKLAKDESIIQNESLSLMEKAEKVYKNLGGLTDEQIKRYQKAGVTNMMGMDAESIKSTMDQLALYYNVVETRDAKTNAMLKARSELMERLGVKE